MDYNKLTLQERYDAARYQGFILPANITSEDLNTRLGVIEITPGEPIAVELIDLYIATQLFNQGIQIPKELDMNNITEDYFIQLAPVLYLDPKLTKENLIRAERIIRIIRAYQNPNMATTVTIATPQKITIVPMTFIGTNQYGDFNFMINRPQFNDVLFLFNDNQEQFFRFMQWIQSPPGTPKDTMACSAGGGNAVIRPYQCLNPPKAAGIPTGSMVGGYRTLQESKPAIDLAIQYIKQLLATGRYARVAYSAAEDGHTLGTGIFNVAPEVKKYIVEQIESLAQV